MIVVNFKAYQEATGAAAVRLAQACKHVAAATDVRIVPAVQAADIRLVASSVSIPVFAQHVDAVSYGAHTGSLLAETFKEAGAAGSLVNHSEHRVPNERIETIVRRLKSLNMIAVVCAKDDTEGAVLAAFEPDYIAVEPPELIGGSISVSTARPELISNAVRKISVPVLVGAGIKNGEDVAVAKKLGAQGILVASGVVKAADPETVLKELAEAMQ